MLCNQGRLFAFLRREERLPRDEGSDKGFDPVFREKAAFDEFLDRE